MRPVDLIERSNPFELLQINLERSPEAEARIAEENRQREERDAADRERWRREWVEMFFSKSYLPVDVRQKTFASFECDHENKAAFDLVNAWNPSDPFGFLLIGPAGSGKSHLMQALVNRIVSEDRAFSERKGTLLWFPVSAGLDVIRTEMNDGSDKYKKKALTCDFLFFDDIGVENPTEWSREQLFQILEHRLCMKAPTFISTNLMLEEIKARMHERVTSRIKEMCVVVQLKGRDRRSDKMKENIAALKARFREGRV